MATVNNSELQHLRDLCSCEQGKGLVVSKNDKRLVSSLVRKGFAWTLASVFTVCIATDAGRDFVASRDTA